MPKSLQLCLGASFGGLLGEELVIAEEEAEERLRPGLAVSLTGSLRFWWYEWLGGMLNSPSRLDLKFLHQLDRDLVGEEERTASDMR